MKKQYMKPTVEAIEVAYEALMMTASGEQGSVGTGEDEAGDNDPDLLHHRRGTWGNLWE